MLEINFSFKACKLLFYWIQTINATFVYRIATFNYINESCNSINEASIYSLQAEKRNFVINGMQLSNKENRTFLLIDDGRSNVQFYIYLFCVMFPFCKPARFIYTRHQGYCQPFPRETSRQVQFDTRGNDPIFSVAQPRQSKESIC